MTQLLGAVELGGAKVICAVGDGPNTELERLRIPTGEPGATLKAAAAFLASHGPLAAVGVAGFGPVRLDEAAPDYGRLIHTPKPGWSDLDLLQPFRDAGLGPISLDTDVNAAALAEWRWGAAKGAPSAAYVTIGSGIGVGAVVNRVTVKGLMHPEFGHLRPARIEGDAFEGVCPFHKDCFEGLASGKAFAARWGMNVSEAPDDHPGLPLHAGYIGRLCADILLTLSPHRIVVGGGGMADRLMAPIREAALEALGGYPPADRLIADAGLIVRPHFADAGLAGAFALAAQASGGAAAHTAC